MRRRLSEKSAFTLRMLHMLHVLHMSGVSEEKDIRHKSNGFELLPPPAGGPPPSRREVFGMEKSKVGRTSAGARCAPLRCTTAQPTVANASSRCNDATQRCKCISQLQFLPTSYRHSTFPPQRPPSSREGDRRSGGRSSRIASPPTFHQLPIPRPPDLPPRGRGTAAAVEGVRPPQAVEGVNADGGRSSPIFTHSRYNSVNLC